MSQPPPTTGAQRTAIIVAGMHRSGTSATTRIINLLGAQLARELIPADIGNERGHWESRAVQALHNRLLAALGSDLYSPVNFPAAWFDSAEAQQWTAHIRDLVAGEYPASNLFVLKDPRIALFLPLWSQALRQAHIVPRFVLPFRHPAAVAASLEARERRLASGDALPPAQGMAVWLRYVLAAEKFTRGELRSFVAFDALLADWRAEELLPGPACRTAGERRAFLEKAAYTHHHPVGTCRMGTDADSVVGPDLAVRGVGGLYVVDASVMPAITTGPTNAAIIAIAERASDLLRGREPLPPARPGIDFPAAG